MEIYKLLNLRGLKCFWNASHWGPCTPLRNFFLLPETSQCQKITEDTTEWILSFFFLEKFSIKSVNYLVGQSGACFLGLSLGDLLLRLFIFTLIDSSAKVKKKIITNIFKNKKLKNSLWPSDAKLGQYFSDNGLSPDGTKPLPEPMLTYHLKKKSQ